ETHFAWMGGFGEESAFYYRVHSPVILVEFDHQRGIVFDSDAPSRTHIHTVVRTPNGNDYGRDLLRQHHEQFDHSRADHHHRGARGATLEAPGAHPPPDAPPPPGLPPPPEKLSPPEELPPPELPPLLHDE